MEQERISVKDLEIKIGVSRRVRPLDVVRPPGYPEGRRYRWSERTVLRRWRRRTQVSTDGSVYRGSRLPPNLWALIGQLRTGGDLLPLDDLTLAGRIAQVRAEVQARGEFLGSMEAGILRVLVAYLTPRGRLDALVDAHADGSHGVPDLFLFKEREGEMVDAVFVEVKRRGETVSREQVAEILRMRALGLRAGVFRFGPEPNGVPAATNSTGCSSS